ncbi:serine/threonine protein kinase [Ornithinimicrobium ciconiae]|uniref:mitogen-activated protein kinase kinase n=1 Tax=Ornithinimicrobium ciconiae TaxID=2594265 RepID=A0A516GDI0_9MICO|nr:serine/threonine-protein kinase [Ornithinimicrobium ciconiae]QDO89586.1 serine/threonine protein kinase [Ornithinimicrobium ciconiae]
MGEVFAGRYELVDPLGEGGAGVVWRVWDQREDCYLAAKVLRQVDAASLLRFIREQAVRIEHPHVLAPLGWAGEDDRVLFTMPIMRGGSVATLVGDFGPLPPRLTAMLLDQLLVALDRIHGQGVIHRDVKPANLLLDATGRELPHLRLSDFGVAAAIDEPRLTHGPVTLGTQGYLAPECHQPGWEPDPRADLYAAGMSALEMVTGQRPAVTRPLEALEGADVPEDLAQVIRWLGEFDPDRRTATAALAREQLAATGLLAGAAAEVLGEIEVFDQVPELPEGWMPDGPSHALPGATARHAHPAAQASTSHETTRAQPSPVKDRRGLGVALLLLLAGAVALLLAAYLTWG